MLFNDVIQTYPKYGIKNLDDVYFFRGESNFALARYFHAEKIFTELVQQYPSSSFLKQAYSRLASIYFSTNDYSNALKYAVLSENVASLSDPDYYDIQYIMAMSNFQLKVPELQDQGGNLLGRSLVPISYWMRLQHMPGRLMNWIRKLILSLRLVDRIPNLPFYAMAWSHSR